MGLIRSRWLWDVLALGEDKSPVHVFRCAIAEGARANQAIEEISSGAIWWW